MVALSCGSQAHAQSDPAAVLEIEFRPTQRAQIALWIEDASGKFLSTVRLTEAVAYRGIGNRPGASEMNSGYRWPYGRREGVLPVWATRRASAPGAQPFKRVIFQDRVEGLASRTASDQSPESYFCLQFDKTKATRDNLDAVSCATAFNSDKGRYITSSDTAASYAEPYEAIGTHEGSRVPLPFDSLYPARMDVVRCPAPGSGSCYDTADVDHYADDVRAVMPDIDVVTMATPPGSTKQSVLYGVPAEWPAGQYVAWLEINVEGDYNTSWNASTNPTPSTPSNDWDSWAMGYGYSYRGQPSIVFKVPFTLGNVGEQTYATDAPIGRSSWDVWSDAFGQLGTMSSISQDPSAAPGSGADRLLADDEGHRLLVHTNVLVDLPDPPNTPDGGVLDPGDTDPGGAGSGGQGSAGTSGGEGSAGSGSEGGSSSGGGTTKPGKGDGKGMIIEGTGNGVDGPVGAIYDLELRHDDNPLRSHTWIAIKFRAAEAEPGHPVHGYDVRIATEPIVDERTFIKNGRQAKNATDDPEGATLLMIPVDVEAGKMIETEIGDLVPQTHYYVGVRATDDILRHGPISVADITTTRRQFATVTPCFVATAAYGTPFAAEIGVLREVRDRYLLTNAPGRWLVHAYYTVGPVLAAQIAEHDSLRALVRAVLAPVVFAARALVD